MLRAVLREPSVEERRRRRLVRAVTKGYLASLLALGGAAVLTMSVSELQALAYEERASVPADAPVEHVRFLEHMLLDEYVSGDRGNTVEAAVHGFRTFWPRGMPTVLPSTTTHAKRYSHHDKPEILQEDLDACTDPPD